MIEHITHAPPTAEVVDPDDVRPGQAGIHPRPGSPAPSPGPDDGSAPSGKADQNGDRDGSGQDDGRTVTTYDVVNPPSRPYD